MSRIQTVILNRDFITVYGFTYALHTYYTSDDDFSMACPFHEYESDYEQDSNLYEYNVIIKLLPPCNPINGSLNLIEVVLYSGPYASLKIIIPHSEYGGHLSVNEYYIKIKVIITYENIEIEYFSMNYNFTDIYISKFNHEYNLYKTHQLSDNLDNSKESRWKFEGRIRNKNYTFSYADNANNQNRYDILLLNKNDRIFTIVKDHNRDNINLEYIYGSTTYKYQFVSKSVIHGYTNSKRALEKIVYFNNLSQPNPSLVNIETSLNKVYAYDSNALPAHIIYRIIHNRDGTDYINYLSFNDVSSSNTYPVVTTSSFSNASPKLFFAQERVRSFLGTYSAGANVYLFDFLTPFIYYTITQNNNFYNISLSYIPIEYNRRTDYDFSSVLRTISIEKQMRTSVSNTQFLTLLGLDYNKLMYYTQDGDKVNSKIIIYNLNGHKEHAIEKFNAMGGGGGYLISYYKRVNDTGSTPITTYYPYIYTWPKLLSRQVRYKEFRHYSYNSV